MIRQLISLGLCLGLLFLTSGCSEVCCGCGIYGADEFVIDSYRVREGKFSILDLEGHYVEELPEEALWEYQDSIQEDDVLNIAIYHPTRTDLSEAMQNLNKNFGFRVKNGRVNIPDLASVQVGGLTLEEAQEHIQSAFLEQIDSVSVHIAYQDRLSRKVDFAGACVTSYLPVDGKMRLYEAFAHAKVPIDANFFMSYILRDDRPLPVDFHRLMKQGDMSQNIVLRGGDKIFIASPHDSQVFVMGEVCRPTSVNLPNGYMPLAQVLVSAGGIPYTGDRRHIQVIRGSLAQPKVYHLAWEHIVHLPNESLLVIPGDTVYVAEKPLTRWNRFISQVLPSFNGLSVGKAAYSTLGL